SHNNSSSPRPRRTPPWPAGRPARSWVSSSGSSSGTAPPSRTGSCCAALPPGGTRTRSRRSWAGTGRWCWPGGAACGRVAQGARAGDLRRLPERYRAPLRLCCLEGLTRDEAARQLGWPVQVLKGRLEQGRKRLRQRLERRGFTLGAALAAALLGEGALPAAV